MTKINKVIKYISWHAVLYFCQVLARKAKPVEQHSLKDVNSYLNTNNYSYLETYGGQSSNLYLNVVNFSTPVLIRHMWQLKTVVILHWCLICAVPLV